MNSTIIFPVTDDFGYILNTIFELVDLRFLVIYLLSFLTLVAFGLLFVYLVVIVLLVEIFQERTPAVIRLEEGFVCSFLIFYISDCGSRDFLFRVGRENKLFLTIKPGKLLSQRN